MEGQPSDQRDGAVADTKKIGWPSAAPEQNMKSLFWMGGVMNCFSSVLSLFSKTELSPTKDDDWEVPYSSLSDLCYLGAGAQGVVFRGVMRGEMVAVKKVRDKNEANLRHLRKLNHENIVRFRGVSVDGPTPCVIMEYCQYGPLFDFLRSGAYISAPQTFHWARDIALGMAYLHSKKIIHRDLKSPNILIADNLAVKVSDFGTAREWDDVSAIMSFTGTVAWMAPEIIRHEPCSERVDVWSFGVVLWELLTQEIPYKNMESHAIMWGVGTDTISLPIPASCPVNLRNLLEACWSRTPRNRPPFELIAANLDIPDEEMVVYPNFSLSAGSSPQTEEALPRDVVLRRQKELELAREFKIIYEQQLRSANELYMEVCAVRLQLEQRERAVSEREKALDNHCHCGVRKALKNINRNASTSIEVHDTCKRKELRRKKKEQAQLLVQFVDNAVKTVSIPDNCDEPSITKNNNYDLINTKTNIIKKNTTIKLKNIPSEPNGNIITGRKKSPNGNYVPEIAHV